MSIETAALERVLARNTQAATEEILAQVMLETGATSAGLFHDQGELRLKGGVGVDQECLDRTHSCWGADANQLREDRPAWRGTWGLLPCRTSRGLLVVYLAGDALRLSRAQESVGGIARLLALVVGEPLEGASPSRVGATAVDLFLRCTSAEEIERRQLTLLLHENEWNIARTARMRGVTRVTVYNWMRRLGIERLRVRRGLKILQRGITGNGGGE